MQAVVKTGGKQYRVAAGDKLIIDRITGEAGDSIVLEQVLMMRDGDKVTLGTPIIAGAVVGAKLLRHTRGRKITVFRRKRRKNFRRTQGHRQNLSLIQITDIAPDGKIKPVSAQPADTPAAKKAAEKNSGAKKATAKTESVKATPAKKAVSETVAKKAAKKATVKKTP